MSGSSAIRRPRRPAFAVRGHTSAAVRCGGTSWLCVFALPGSGSVAEATVQKRVGQDECPCLDDLPALTNATINIANPSATSFGRQPAFGINKEDCLIVKHLDRLKHPNEEYCYPTDYGRGRCAQWDVRLPPECASQAGASGDGDIGLPERCRGWQMSRDEPGCKELLEPARASLPWCGESWCYVDPKTCRLPHHASYYFPDSGMAFSYATCGSPDYFDIWGVVQLEMCRSFEVVEKPYPIMWLSCWACAFVQQIIDATRRFEEHQDRLSMGQRVYLAIQLGLLIAETAENIKRISWGSGLFWMNYNLYVYVFINSSVFVRATMMSQVVWDWYDAKLLKHAVLHASLDGKGWNDEMRAGLLVLIFQFASSMGVFGVICLTHLVPALFVYHWIFLTVAAGLVKSRSWVGLLGVDPESRSGRALVMGTNSFLSCMGIQVLVTCMVRVYAGEWAGGYLSPLRTDFLMRRLDVWYACHLSRGFCLDMFWDRDFVNLFIR